MIKIINKAYQVGDTAFISLEDAQRAEIQKLAEGEQNMPTTFKKLSDWVVVNKASLVDILTMTASSRPRARKVNGGVKTRKSVTEPISAPVAQQDSAALS